jgi:hypothetical protein
MSRRFDTGCLVEVENRFESLGAHVRLDGDVPLHPGDRVTVHGTPIVVPFGHVHAERRTATVERAGPMRRLWARHVRQWDLTSLYEVGFDGDAP